MWKVTRRFLNYISIEDVSKIVLAKLEDPQGRNHTLLQTFLIDVRSTQEVHQTGMIPTAVCIPLPILETVLDETYVEGDEYFRQFPPCKESAAKRETTASYDDENVLRPRKEESTLIFYCAHGIRSAAAVDIAEALGYRHIYNFSGSWAQWHHTYIEDHVDEKTPSEGEEPTIK